MPLDPAIATMLAAASSRGGPLSMVAATPEASRNLFRAITVGVRDPRLLAEVGSVHDDVIPGPGGTIRLRVYRPDSAAVCPTLLFFHGGGFVVGDLDTHDDHARILCREVGCVVVSVDYRLAPEHRFPAALDDCVAATRWAAEHVGELGADAGRIAVAGDSAGANLAAAVAINCARDGDPRLAAQLLLYPSTDFRKEEGLYPSRRENGEGLFLTETDMTWFAQQYLPDAAAACDPRASVILAPDLSTLAPAVIATGEHDPLRDEGAAYAQRLERAGVGVAARCYEGMIHGFFGMGAWSPAAASAGTDICAALRRLLGGDDVANAPARGGAHQTGIPEGNRGPVTSAAPTTLIAGLGFPEAPRWHDGRLWFSDMALGSVHTVDAGGRVDTVVQLPGRPSGLGWSRDAALLVVSMEDRALLAVRDGELSLVADLSMYAAWHANDMVVDARGRAYVGNFGFDYLRGEAVRPARLMRVDPDGSVAVAAEGLLFPNGMVISPDGTQMVVAETFGSCLTAFDIAPNGALSDRRVLAQLDGIYPDGICLDAEGAIWVSSPTTGDVLRVSRSGEVVARVQTGRAGAFACMLGGDDRRTLFICCADGSDPDVNRDARSAEIMQLRVDVPGAGLP